MRSVEELIACIKMGVGVGLLSCAVDRYMNIRRGRTKSDTEEDSKKEIILKENQAKRVDHTPRSYHTLSYTELIFEKENKSPVFLQRNVYTDRHYKCKLATTKEADYFEFYHYNQKEITAIIDAVNKSILKPLDCSIDFGREKILPIARKMCVGEIDLEKAILAFQDAEIIGVKEYNNHENKNNSFVEELFLIMPSLIIGGDTNAE
jgi:hypothetical protein